MAESFRATNHFLTSLLITVAITITTFKSVHTTATNTEFVKSSCTVTTYPRLCVASLSTHASLIQTSPKLMAHAALNITLASAKATSVMMVRLSSSSQLKPREVSAMRVCVEELGDTLDELRKSIGEMGQLSGSSYEVYMSDIQTWVSAALTDENTCTDGFGGDDMNGKVKIFVRERILVIAHLTTLYNKMLIRVKHFQQTRFSTIQKRSPRLNHNTKQSTSVSKLLLFTQNINQPGVTNEAKNQAMSLTTLIASMVNLE
ncbi:hypothetical protein YC2023_105519 [Brassica napus]